MSGGDNSAAADDEIIEIGDSTEFPPPLKKSKTDPKAEPAGKVDAEAETEVEAEAEREVEAEAEEELPQEIRSFLPKDWNDPKYKEQADLFLEQVEKDEGCFYMDLDKFDYKFAPVKFEWRSKFDAKLNNKELMDLLIKTAIDAQNEDEGTQLEFVKYVSANVTAAQGFCFYITLLAKDLCSPNLEPQLYQTFVSKFRDEIHVHEFKLRPPQQE